jgi:2-polyprenyl-3-methyl-5-hydroxy-6-metoxy-1,4-benzoquinol methylase
MNMNDGIRKLIRVLRRTRDKNFIGFDKYERHGAFHWRELENNAIYRQKVETIMARVSSSDVVLDIGCGDGAYAAFIAKKCKSVVGVDADYDAIRLAKTKAQCLGIPNCRFIQSAIGRLSFRRTGVRRPFDVIYSMDVIEHLPDPEELLKAATSLISSNGLIIIGTPLFISPELVSPYHVREFTLPQIRDLVQKFLRAGDELLLPIVRMDGKLHENEEGFYVFSGYKK